MARALSADSITLSLPHAKPYHGVARLVVGGLAARLELSYEHLEDLQLALESVLERDGYVLGDAVTVRLLVAPDASAWRRPARRGRIRRTSDRDHDDESRYRGSSTLVAEVGRGGRGRAPLALGSAFTRASRPREPV